MVSIKNMLKESSKVLENAAMKHEAAENISQALVACLKRGNKIMLAGNGGSAAEATHIAAEFTGRYKKERNGLPAISLASDMAAITAIGNDYGFEKIFSRQIEALGTKGDVLILLSTSGNSQNLINAIEKAKKLSIGTVALLGKEGGTMKGKCDHEIIVQSDNTPRIQEAHLAIMHSICEKVEEHW